jgi:predicted AAA+ superfamily ATPase
MNVSDYLPDSIILRQRYLEKSLIYLDKEIIKILTGQRRVGKSYLLFQLMKHLIQNRSGSNVIFISKELPEFRFIKSGADLLHFLVDKQKPKNNYLFIDEVQEIEGFENVLRSLLAQRKWDIWCTGSNASMLSKDVAGLLSGRAIEIKVNSLTYVEFIRFHNLENTDETLNKYLKFGGLPYLINLELNEPLVNEYLKGIYNSILFKDVVSRHGIRNTRFLENLVQFVAANVGSIFSAKKISDYLKSQGENMPPNLVLEYLSFLCDAFFTIKVIRADIKGKRFFEVGEKYFFEDIGLRNMVAGYRPADIGKIIENVIFMHMQAQGFQVYTGTLGNREIDFVCERNAERIYIQAAYLIPDEKVQDREFGNLLLIQDNYPKYVVSMDPVKWDSVKGIQHFQLREFLMMEL